ncbi:MAG TPA: UvrD-helicase domain-containing protein, partial [Candidatus Eremiobacteraceae bacterium]|nr:UvrD-helicase domain-containing protein [Candidatus Eremiobacteraceae bacterium]
MSLVADKFPPTPQQLEIIRQRGSNLLIFAGPGTGKTETLARRFASLVADDGVAPSQILVLTFSRRAAQEMRDRVLLRLRQRLGSGLAVSELFIKTFHSFCGRLLEGGNRGTQRRLLTPVKERLLWRRVVRPENITLEWLDPKLIDSSQFATDCLNVIAQLKGRGLDAPTLERIAGDGRRLRDIARIYAAMERARAERGLHDFRDLVIEALHALEEGEGTIGGWLREAAFRHVLVDEFQDSDFIDLRLLQRLATALTPQPTFCFVGDVNQSIYRFRGASPDNVERARELFACDTLPLDVNRRSAQAILDIANADGSLSADSLTKAVDTTKPGSVRLVRPRTVDDEVRAVCAAILGQLAHGVAARDIAVLLRQNYPHRELITASLRNAGVPVAALPSAGFHEDGLVDAALSGLRLLAQQTDLALWRRLLVNPILGYRAVDVGNAFDAARRGGRVDVDAKAALVATPPFGPRPINWFLRGWKRCEEAFAGGDPLAVLQRLVAELDLLRPIREAAAVPGFDKTVSPLRLEALLTAAQDYAEVAGGSGAAAGTARLDEFIERLDETLSLIADGLEPPPSAAEGVRVMSIHAAKGLEFEFVAIPQLIEGILPASERPNRLLSARDVDRLRREHVDVFADKEAALKEEHSLWYVALTRAKSRILVSAPQVDGEGIDLQLSGLVAPIVAREEPAGVAPAEARVAAASSHAEPSGNGSRSGTQTTAATGEGIRLDLLALSPSRINDFMVCPRRFFYGSVLKLQRDDDEATLPGTLLHAVLKRFHEQETDFVSVTNAHAAVPRYFKTLQWLVGEELKRSNAGDPNSSLVLFIRRDLETRL